MYLSGGKRRGKDYEHYICRRLECDDHAYARAEQLDTFVLNRVEERLTGVDYDGPRIGDPAARRRGGRRRTLRGRAETTSRSLRPRRSGGRKG
jgi:hypothetical protein